MGFKVGDLVYITQKNHHCQNMAGTVRYIKNSDVEGIGVEFDSEIESGHNLGGAINSRRGYFMSSSGMVKLLPFKEALASATLAKKAPDKNLIYIEES